MSRRKYRPKAIWIADRTTEEALVTSIRTNIQQLNRMIDGGIIPPGDLRGVLQEFRNALIALLRQF